ncbi:uncharacterized protein LOC132296102 [Cornus florida]|uniref:uncharacterized protein LOC132296102 n=1 Tax=Cornus florida TaxID=4283 RepID=UPI0028A0FB71|nr:uncharacterized protein LOC132296102 [Cornus florida]
MGIFTPENLKALFKPKKRRYIKRDREDAAQQLWKDYFAENPVFPPEYFRRRFRMRRQLFLRILNDITTHDNFFKQKPDATGRMGVHPYIEDDKQYLCSSNESDIAHLLQEGEERGFPSMLGCIDCMHWEWKNCPKRWHGTHKGRGRKPTLILEAIASKNLWIWHAFFGMAGLHIDVNVLDHSPVFNRIINGIIPPVNYEMNGHHRTLGYYLSDGIYPKWAALIQTIPHPTTEKDKLFAQRQEAVRKDVERAFGVLQIRWVITHGPIYYWKKEDLSKIMRTCIILHNMIIENEGDTNILEWTPPTDESVYLPQYNRDRSFLAAHISTRLSRIRNVENNGDLRRDLMEHL